MDSSSALPLAITDGARTPEALPEELRSGRLLRRIGGLAILGLVIALLVTTLPGLDDVRRRFAHVQPAWLVALVTLEVASCLSYVIAFRSVFCTNLGWRFSYQVGLAEQATNVLLPAGGAGGLALGAWVLRQGGMGGERIARRSVAFFVLTSAPNFLCAATFGFVVAAAGSPGPAPLFLTLVLAVLATAAIVIVASSPWILRRLARTPAAAESGASTIRRARALVRRGALSVGAGVQAAGVLLRKRQPGAVVGSVGYMAFDVAALAAAFTALGSLPPLTVFVFAYVIGQLGGLIPLPGGVGGTDGGLVAALTLYGTPLAESTAAVLA